jgi:hypothetical protein
MITETDKAWLAGVVDSCAVFYLHTARPNQRPKPRLEVIVKDHRIMARARELFPGTGVIKSSGVRYTDRFQCAEHCPIKHVHVRVSGRSDRWILPAARTMILLYNIRAYSVRWPDFQGPYEEYMSSDAPRFQMKIVNQLALLGWDIPDKKPGKYAARRSSAS